MSFINFHKDQDMGSKNFKVISFLRVLAAVIALSWGASLAAAQISSRQAIFLKPAVDAVSGNVMFRVSHAPGETGPSPLGLMLPKESSVFTPVHGFTGDDVVESSDARGALTIDKTFEPGENFIVYEFSAPASYGQSFISFEAPYEIKELAFFAQPKQLLYLGWQGRCHKEENSTFNGMLYNVLICPDVKKGETVALTIGGIPEGRLRYHILGAVAAAVLFVGAGLTLWATRRIKAQTAQC
jgi:hypothetical protein